MNMRHFALNAFISAATAAATQSAPDLAPSVDLQLPVLTETYRRLHRAPELSHHEEKTSAFLAAELRKLGYTVTENVGNYEAGSQAHGIVSILQNGSGRLSIFPLFASYAEAHSACLRNLAEIQFN